MRTWLKCGMTSEKKYNCPLQNHASYHQMVCVEMIICHTQCHQLERNLSAATISNWTVVTCTVMSSWMQWSCAPLPVIVCSEQVFFCFYQQWLVHSLRNIPSSCRMIEDYVLHPTFGFWIFTIHPSKAPMQPLTTPPEVSENCNATHSMWLSSEQYLFPSME